MTATAVERPGFTGFHHFASTVSDLTRSAAWYERVLGLTPGSTLCPDDGTTDGVLLSDPDSGIAIRLHGAGGGEPRGHAALSVSNRAQLDTWAGWFDGLGVLHSGVVDVGGPEPYAYLVFRDPDDLPLVLVHVVE
ncbi:VOC family protein [Actinomycetospora rhizophila]|uniref:VOC family protein n=1 Tax=Actinomycetospora rhizophila TaxID=1416876 RepID=A0ABV9ZJW4_9PSEU